MTEQEMKNEAIVRMKMLKIYGTQFAISERKTVC